MRPAAAPFTAAPYRRHTPARFGGIFHFRSIATRRPRFAWQLHAMHRCAPRRIATQRNDPRIKGPGAKPCRPSDRSLGFGSWLVPQAIRLSSCLSCALAQPSVPPPKKSRIISISHGVRSSVGFTRNPSLSLSLMSSRPSARRSPASGSSRPSKALS